MAQHDYVIANGTGAAVRSDLNNALAAIVSQNSGATEPATMYAYQWWADTTTGLLKLRNGANNAWITLRELDGTLTIEDGTAGAPGLAFADDLNTGVFSPGADQVAFTAGGTARLTATTTGITSALPVDVPLGSASAPTVTFTGDLNTGIYSPGADQVAVATNGTQRLTVDTAATTSTLPVVHPLGAVGTPSITFTGDLNTGIWSPAADTIAFSEGGVEAMRIDSSGRVGIGTTSPVATLHSRADSAGSGSTPLLIQNRSVSANTAVGISFAPNTSDTADRSAIIYGVNSSGGSGNATDLTFHTNANGGSPTEKARIDSSGRLLVGTSTATTNGGVLQVSNGITFPATQSACSDANTLDDYEEGTWTPAIPGTSITYFSQQGYYTKIGNVVYVHFYVVLSGGTPTGGAGAAIVSGLPFTSEATHYTKLATSTSGGNFGGTVPIAQVTPSSTAISAIGVTNNAAFVDSTTTSVWDANNNWVSATGFYRIA